jgi:hypothetical protein
MDPEVGAQDRNSVKEALDREPYLAAEAMPRARLGMPGVGEALHEFVVLMREDERQIICRGEPNAARAWCRRELKPRARLRAQRYERGPSKGPGERRG